MADARREAFEAGREQGEQQARAELNPVLERLNASIAEVVAMRPDLRARPRKTRSNSRCRSPGACSIAS